jgi:hypothetical protein
VVELQETIDKAIAVAKAVPARRRATMRRADPA